ncbi:ADAM 17-like protease [Lamellibrachia satsuma]|nr:ADAM 17-like protease [Lamellibrachia satsuma]
MHCLIFTLVCYCSISVIAASPLDDILMRYETLDQSQFHHKPVKRSADNSNPNVRHVQFDSQGRQFHMYLQRRQNLLSPNFRLVSVDKYNKEEEITLDAMNHFYQGVLEDEPDTSEVHAFWEDDGTMTATIKTHADIYYVEPSWRHLPESSNYSMISYKASDMKIADNLGDSHNHNTSYCGFVRIDNSEQAAQVNEQESAIPEPDRERRREKRSSQYPTKNTCPLLVVADYRFVKNMGQGSVSKTAIYLIGLIERVDAIYRETNFGSGYEKQMGFEIKELRIHKAPSVTAGGLSNYNMERETWDTKNLLEVFSRDVRIKQFCLAHLFTYQAFEGGVLGLAYIGSARRYDDYLSNFCLAHLFTALVNTDGILGLSYVASTQRYNPGGICSQAYYKGKNKLYLNTGWSSSLNRYERRLLTQEADLVTTHGR